MKVVVDTSILIDYLRGGKKWEMFIKEIDDGTELLLPTIVIFELFSGSSTKSLAKRFDIIDLLKQFRQIDLNEAIARVAGELYRDVKQTLEVPDYIIAASALQFNATVVTLNKKHFEQIPNIHLYY